MSWPKDLNLRWIILSDLWCCWAGRGQRLVPGNVDEGAGVEEEQEEEPPNALNGESGGSHHWTCSPRGPELLPPPSHWEYLVGQPIVFTLSKYAVAISDSQLWSCTRAQRFFFLLYWESSSDVMFSFSHRLFSQECRGCPSSWRTGSEGNLSPGTTGLSRATDSGG